MRLAPVTPCCPPVCLSDHSCCEGVPGNLQRSQRHWGALWAVRSLPACLLPAHTKRVSISMQSSACKSQTPWLRPANGQPFRHPHEMWRGRSTSVARSDAQPCRSARGYCQHAYLGNTSSSARAEMASTAPAVSGPHMKGLEMACMPRLAVTSRSGSIGCATSIKRPQRKSRLQWQAICLTTYLQVCCPP